MTKKEVQEISDNTGFQKDTLEKVFRLVEVLKFIRKNSIFNNLKLKGGTALQLVIFNFKRLSVDIDFDYHSNDRKETIQKSRDEIKDLLTRYMQNEGYALSLQSKFHYSLDSFVFKYTNLADNPDNIKIDINYTNRIHVLEPIIAQINHKLFNDVEVGMLSELELYATKVNALISRTMPRDLYDTYLIAKEEKIDKKNYDFFRKLIIFYFALSNNEGDFHETLKLAQIKLDKTTFFMIKKTLIPVLSKQEAFDINHAVKAVSRFLNDVFQITEEENQFIKHAHAKDFKLELLFEPSLAVKLKNHPRILWLVKNKVE